MDEHLPTEHDRPDPWWQSPRGRIGLAVAALAVVLGVLKLTAHSTTEMTILSVPSPLSQNPNEVRRRLQQAGVSPFEYANGQLQVPASAAESAAAALRSEDSSDRHWADEWEAANSKLGHFSGTRERDAAREIARARQICRMLNQMQGIANADVVWDDDKHTGWNHVAKSRATVYLKPQPGSEITPEIIRSVRAAVAGSKANLSPDNVIVMDLNRRITYEATTDEPIRRQQDQQRDERSAIYRHRIEQLLQHVDGIRVGVFIDDVPFQTAVDHPWTDPPEDQLATRIPGVAPPMPRIESKMASGILPAPLPGSRPDVNHPEPREQDVKAASRLLGINQEMAELVHVHLAVPEEFYLRKLEMLASTDGTTLDVVERNVNAQLQKRVDDALPDSGPSPEVVIDLIPGERVASVPVDAPTRSLDPLSDPSVLFPLCGVGLVFFAVGWAVVAARRGTKDLVVNAPLPDSVTDDSELHTNPLEFLVTSRFSDWLPALLMEPAEKLARIVSVLPSQQVGELMARLPMGVQIDVLQLAARQAPPTMSELEEIAHGLENEVQLPEFSSQSLFHRASHAVG